MKRSYAVFVVILAISSLMMFGSASAQTIPKPSVPEFTVKFVDHSYVVPTSTSIDPYTGQQVTHPSYKVQNRTIDITIKNQPFIQPDNLTNLFYNIREKGYFENSWSELYHITNRTNDNALLRQSGSEYTVLSIPSENYPQRGQVDFQVQAYIATGHLLFSPNSNFGYWTWEASDWSPIQTITIPETANTSPNPSPTIPELPLVSVIFLFAIASISLVYLKRRKGKH